MVSCYCALVFYQAEIGGVTVRVFILDDNRALRERLRRTLGNIAGGAHTAACFDNVADLMENYDSVRPDFTFIRLGNTAFSGLRAAERLKALDAYAKIIFVSQTDRYALYAFQAGAVGFLMEPVDEGKVREIVLK